jgi:leucyl aminopeptidase
MNVRFSPRFPAERPAELAVLFQFEGEARPWGASDARLIQRVGRLARGDSFRGREGQTFLWHAGTRLARRWLVLGLGDRKCWDVQRLRQACAVVVQHSRQIGARNVSVPLPDPRLLGAEQTAVIERMAAALGAAALSFDKYRSKREEPRAPMQASICVPGGVSAATRRAIERGRLEARAMAFTQDLVNEPGGALPPPELAERARRMARGAGLSCRVLDVAGLKRKKMGAILGVGGGSSHPPRLIHLSYRPRGRARSKVALVGKGITFDSGGLSLKPAASMEDMKSDKAGAAAVLGVMSVVSDLALPIEVHGVVAAAENMPGGRAIKPGDVVQTCSGKTVEVLNTDAEGRLVLADALTYAVRLGVKEMVDVATLTGAVMIALGARVFGIMGNRPHVVARLRRAAEESGESAWELPLVAAYREQLKSSIADLRNTGDRWGGAIFAGLFLEAFVDDSVSWAHLDIAGPAFSGKGRPGVPKGATGTPVPTLLRYLELAAEA